MLDYEKISFGIITHAGSAKSYAFESIELSEEGKFTEAEKMIDLGREELILAEKTHMDVISTEASGKKIEFSFLLMHAEDQMMSSSLMLEMAEKFITLYKKMEEKNNGKI